MIVLIILIFSCFLFTNFYCLNFCLLLNSSETNIKTLLDNYFVNLGYNKFSIIGPESFFLLLILTPCLESYPFASFIHKEYASFEYS